MGKKLYVGNLPDGLTDVQLKDMFAACGAVVSAEIPLEKKTGLSRGFGFVEMGTYEEAQAAVKKLHDAAIGGKRLVVNEAKPIPEKPQRGFRGFDGGGGGGYGGSGGGYGGSAGYKSGFRSNQKGHDRRGGGGGGKGG